MVAWAAADSKDGCIEYEIFFSRFPARKSSWAAHRHILFPKFMADTFSMGSISQIQQKKAPQSQVNLYDDSGVPGSRKNTVYSRHTFLSRKGLSQSVFKHRIDTKKRKFLSFSFFLSGFSHACSGETATSPAAKVTSSL